MARTRAAGAIVGLMLAPVLLGCGGSGTSAPKVGECVNNASGPGLPPPTVVSCRSPQANYRVVSIVRGRPSSVDPASGRPTVCSAPATAGYSFANNRTWCLAPGG